MRLFLVVDGPVPDTLDSVIKTYSANPMACVYRFKENQGHRGKARRLGLKKCSNALVALMDADDIDRYRRFELELAMFEHNPDLSIVGGQVNDSSYLSKNPEESVRSSVVG